jgi:hypothetical protein
LVFGHYLAEFGVDILKPWALDFRFVRLCYYFMK